MTDKKEKPSAASQSPVVKSVRPYPFDIEILIAEGLPPVKGQVLKITEVGFLMRSSAHHFKVGENHTVRFALPLHRGLMNESVKVIKTYDSFDVEHVVEKGKALMAEMHFRHLGEKNREEILKFIRDIGQK